MRIKIMIASLLAGALAIIGVIPGGCAATRQTPAEPPPMAALINIVLDPEQFMGVDNYRGEFQTRIITVALGATVTWNNTDRRVHTVVSRDGLFDKTLEYAESFSYTFTQNGSFAYYDKLYDNMDGVVNVK